MQVQVQDGSLFQQIPLFGNSNIGQLPSGRLLDAARLQGAPATGSAMSMLQTFLSLRLLRYILRGDLPSQQCVEEAEIPHSEGASITPGHPPDL